jgi:hypothetical protein
VQRADLALVARPGDADNSVVLVDLDRRRDLQAQLALRARDVDLAAVDPDIDAARHNDRQPSDS